MSKSRGKARWTTWLASAVVALLTAQVARAGSRAEPSVEQRTFFETKVRPLLAENCFKCHGAEKQKGKLRLDSLAAALQGGEDGPAFVPGHPEQSRLVTAVAWGDPDFQMPPKDRLSAEQVAALTQWIAVGAPWPDAPATAAAPLAKSKHRVITEQDRAFWSFQPVKNSPVPAVADGGWSRNPIDSFVFAKLKAEGLTPAPEADRITLIRRVTFDVTGVPPTLSEVEGFVADKSPDAYEKLVDRLLASPGYGERYARHWLDLVRYAESDGFKQDAYRPAAWTYRDYVIKSFNDDKPYDRFVTEQLAGDEVDPTNPDALAATGYFRNGVYEYNQRNSEGAWHDYLNDLTDVTADTFLGLSLGCARCHDHKFDPILQADYFKLQAFFAPILPRSDLALGTPAQRQAYDAALQKWEQKTAPIRTEIDQILAQPRKNAVARIVGKFPPDVQTAMNKPPAERTPYDRQIAYLVDRQIDEEMQKLDEKVKGPDKDRLIELRKQLGQHDDERPRPLQAALCVTDVGPVAPPTRIPGDAQKREIDPGYPVVLDGQPLKTPTGQPTATSTGRRTALAQWITQPNNPVTTRVIANRLWQWHFGKGLVRTSSDYGRLGDPPSHPELLDWLTRQFVDGGWSMKKAHRLILTSATYRQASVRPVPEVAKLKDPENRWLWRFNAQRLEAEQARDAMLAVSGELDDKSSGPAAETTATRRTVFTKAVRNVRDPLLEAFDQADSFGSVPARNQTTTATQSLLMINGDWPLKRATAFAARVARETKSAETGALVDTAYRLAYCRFPRPDERTAAVTFLTSRPPTEHVAVAEAPPEEGKPADAVAAGTPAAAAPAPAAASGTAFDMPITQLMPQRGTQAILIRNANPGDLLRLDATPSLPDADFTIEAFVQLESLYENASVRVIASQWSGRNEEPGWSFGVTSERSKYLPRNLILQLAGRGADGKVAYEVVPSDFRLELHKAYYLAAAVRLKDTTEAGVTFYLKDLTDMDAPLRSTGVKHTMTGDLGNERQLVIGGRDSAPAQGWDGLIDEVQLSNAPLKPEQLLYNEGHAGAAVVGHWVFEETPGFMKDSAGRQHDLTRRGGANAAIAAGKTPKATAKAEAKVRAPSPVGPSVKVDAALVDFCHALFNSNEFLYVD